MCTGRTGRAGRQARRGRGSGRRWACSGGHGRCEGIDNRLSGLQPSRLPVHHTSTPLRALFATLIAAAAAGSVWAADPPPTNAARGAKTTPQTIVVVHAGRLLDHPGKAPRGPSTIVIRDGRISEVRDGFIDVPGSQRVIDQRTRFVLPGLDRQSRAPGFGYGRADGTARGRAVRGRRTRVQRACQCAQDAARRLHDGAQPRRRARRHARTAGRDPRGQGGGAEHRRRGPVDLDDVGTHGRRARLPRGLSRSAARARQPV